MSEVRRKKSETFESFLRRFNRRLLQSGRLLQARKIRFFTKPKNTTKKRAGALRRKRLKEQHEYLEKIGKLPEEKRFKRR